MISAGPPGRRWLSLDLFRGVTMFLLVIEGTGLYHALSRHGPAGGIFRSLVLQFHHHPWHGLRFWDLIQPFFMFIVGVAMTFSLTKRRDAGQSRGQISRHIVIRCLILLLLGVMLHCGYKHRLVWELWNVLSQLSFTILAAYLIFRLPARRQILISLGLLALTEALYRFVNLPGFDQPFVQGKNFGAWMDTVLMGKINPDGWVAVNCLPTAAHTIWGVLAGKLLQSGASHRDKLARLAVAGSACLALGYSLDWAGVTPIIKRICTSSFVLASGGWCLLALASCYWLADMRGKRAWMNFFTVVGMNSIFIYLFSNTMGLQWLNGWAEIFTAGALSPLGIPVGAVRITNALLVLAMEWGLCRWLFKRKIFFKI